MVISRKARLLTVTQDHQQEKALREELQTKQAGLTRLEEEYRNCQTSSPQLESEMNKLRQEKVSWWMSYKVPSIIKSPRYTVSDIFTTAGVWDEQVTTRESELMNVLQGALE